ncbi:M20 metallopeptidase family protein [Fretibacterium fastidiosum]|uniref:Amidohydrolase n=1 Tax=Fretibacterium fastidiosum TaxID=651822 RepID=A0AB94IVA7_9BACT|nr:M20 family metallopeptidase [Fretibacterium fastidiosum]CBL27674.1 amidohydrolase [Fretibacterium fastidiosum]
MDFISLEKDAIGWRRHIHQHPELGFKEFETTKYIRERLEEFGIADFIPLKETGVAAVIHGASAGPCIAFRADIDALPTAEDSGYPWPSLNPGVCHACGHDVHTAVLLGLSKALQQERTKLAGSVKLIFQPGEEIMCGAESIIRSGVLEDPIPEAIVGLHIWPQTPCGDVAFCHGPMMASSDSFTITVTGKQGHGAHPEVCVDALYIAAQVLIAVQGIVAREVSPTDPSVVTIGTIVGGLAPNITAGEAVMKGTMRCMTLETRSYIKEALERIARQTAIAHKGNATVKFAGPGIPPVISDEKVLREVEIAAQQALGEDHIRELKEPSMGSEDFSLYLKKIPGAFYRLGTALKDNAATHKSLHSPQLFVPDEAIIAGIRVMYQFAVNRLGKG